MWGRVRGRAAGGAWGCGGAARARSGGVARVALAPCLMSGDGAVTTQRMRAVSKGRGERARWGGVACGGVVPAGSPRRSRGAGAGRVWPAVVPGRAAQRHTHWNAPRAQRRASGCARRWQGERDAPALSHVPVPIFVCRMWRHTVTLGACGCVPWMRGWGGARETERPSCVVCVWLDESPPPPCVHGLAHVCSRERLYILMVLADRDAHGTGVAERSGACPASPHAELYRARESVCGPRTSKLMNIQHSHNTDHTCHRTPQAGSCVCHAQTHPASGIDADARNAPSLPHPHPHARSPPHFTQGGSHPYGKLLRRLL